MAQKKEDYEDEGPEEDSTSKFSLDKSTILALIAFIALSGLFFYFLSIKTETVFGFVQVIFAIITGIVITLFLMWIRFMISSNKYLGAFISIVGIVAIVYALTRKYQGTYTTTFITIGIILAMAYTISYFIKFYKK